MSNGQTTIYIDVDGWTTQLGGIGVGCHVPPIVTCMLDELQQDVIAHCRSALLPPPHLS